MLALAKEDCSQRTPGFERLHDCDDVCAGNRNDGINNIEDVNAALNDIDNVPVTEEEFLAAYLENYYLTVDEVHKVPCRPQKKNMFAVWVFYSVSRMRCRPYGVDVLGAMGNCWRRSTQFCSETL